VGPHFLGLDEVLAIHEDQLERYGGAAGVRAPSLLGGAVAAPKAGTTDGYLHADLYGMAAAYLFHLVNDHPFVDGNKRVGLVACLLFLELNGIQLQRRIDGLYDLVIGVAEGRTHASAIADYLRAHAGPSPGRS
jgi:death on curing protein